MNNKPAYLSKEGLEKLREELDEMVNMRRAEIAARIHEAKEHGDITENAEYEDAKNEQAFVEGRIQALSALVKNAVVIDGEPLDHARPDRVNRDAAVAGRQGELHDRRLRRGGTGAGTNLDESPVGRALLGHKKGEEITVSVPAGDTKYKIVSIS